MFFCGIIPLYLDVWDVYAFGTPCSGLVGVVVVTPYQHLIFSGGKDQVCCQLSIHLFPLTADVREQLGFPQTQKILPTFI